MQFGKQEAKNKMNTHNDRFCKKIGLGHVPGGTCRGNMINKIYQQEQKRQNKANFYRRESSLSGPKLDTYAES